MICFYLTSIFTRIQSECKCCVGFLETSEVTQSSSDTPWLSIPDKIDLDLYTSFQGVMNEMEFRESDEVRPSFVARFGKIFFHG